MGGGGERMRGVGRGIPVNRMIRGGGVRVGRMGGGRTRRKRGDSGTGEGRRGRAIFRRRGPWFRGVIFRGRRGKGGIRGGGKGGSIGGLGTMTRGGRGRGLGVVVRVGGTEGV